MKDTMVPDRELKQREKKLINSFLHVPCRVSLIQNKYGKIPSTLKNAIYIEYDNLLKLFAEYLPDTLDQN